MASRSAVRKIGSFQLQRQSLHFSSYSYSSSAKAKPQRHETNMGSDDDDFTVPTAGISRPLSQILKDLNKKVPESLLRSRTELSGSSFRYIPWHILNRILNLHAPEWSGEVRSITYSADGNSVSVVYRITLYGTDAEPEYLDTVKSLPRPLPVAAQDADSPDKIAKDKEEEHEDKDSCEHLSEKELLQRHVKRAKRVRSRLREERLQRITRYKTRLALLLPPMVEQHFKNESDPAN